MTHSPHNVKTKRIRPHGKFRGPIIPNTLMRYRNLSAGAKLIWGRLSQFQGKNGDAFPSVTTLSRETGLSPRHVVRMIRKLEHDGFVEIEHRPGRSSLFYMLLHPCLGGDKMSGVTHDKMSEVESEDFPLPSPDEISPMTLCQEGGDKTSGVPLTICQGGSDIMSPISISLKQKKNKHHHQEEPDPISDASKNGGGVSFSGNGKKPSPLTPDQQAYLELSVAYQEEHGGFQKSKAAFTRWITKELVGGRRDMSDLEELQAWKDGTEWGPKYRDLDEEDRQAEEQREEADRQEQELLREVRAKLLPAITGAPEEHIRYLYDAGYGDMPLYAVQHVLSDEFPELVKQIRQERLDAQERKARERLGLATRGHMSKKPKSEQITELIAKYLREGNFNQAEAFLPEHPDEYNEAIRIVTAGQPDEMTF